ncbi:hypothetical protein JMJ35_004629 [Cladonia borealis]|uniref:Uncharacterized protein n=1 Tax=Cladonia borealis TaxID=184061 RepID=A0AA39R0E3_9LECA|nr:hypothetical protein JMJ35_004629 [Cladonia borealis]
MAQQQTPWNLTQDYVALTRRDIPPGGRTDYVVPHPVGATPTDVTSFVYGQADVTIDNWPNIMYMLEPTQAWKDFKALPKPAQKLDHNGQPMWEKWPQVGERPRPILDFPVLPDNISTTEDWWFFHLWRRIDPRINWTDITMRMEIPQRTAKDDIKWNNRIVNMSRRVWGKKYYILSWFQRRPTDNTHVYNALRDKNIPLHLNTTRGITPGLVDPNQPNGPRIPRPVLGRLGRPRGPNKNASRPRRKAGQEPPSEHEEDEEDDVDLIDEDIANDSEDEDEHEDEDEDADDDEGEEEDEEDDADKDEDEDESSENDDEDQEVLEDDEEEQEVCLHSCKRKEEAKKYTVRIPGRRQRR